MSNARTVIVGSGVAAVALARRVLTKDKTAQVLMLEAGGHFALHDYRTWLDFVMNEVPPTRAYEDRRGEAEINQDDGFVLIGGRMLSRGGSTNHWGGWCPRMKPEDFHLGNVRPKAINWQIGYDDLASYYTQAEEMMSVCGDSASTSVPRYGQSFPHMPVPFTALDGILIPALKRLGYGYEALPIARNPARCMTTGTCRYCPLDARYAAGSDLDRLIGDFPDRLEVRINSPVTAVTMKDGKTAAGVNYRDLTKNVDQFAPADRVVVAGGTIESAKLLLSSTSSAWSNGLGNRTGHVGKHLVTHPLLRGVAALSSNPERFEQEIDFPTMACRHFDTEKYQAAGKMFFVRDGKYVVVSLANRLIGHASAKQVDADIETATRVELRGLMEAFPDDGNFVTLAPGTTAAGLPRTRIQYREAPETKQARVANLQHLQDILREAGLKDSPALDSNGARADHATGTCRMSSSAADGVVDKNLRVHDTDNVFVCSNAVFPNAGAVNPTLTLVALAYRLGDHLTS